MTWEYIDSTSTLVNTVGSCPSTILTRLGVLAKVLGRITAKESFKEGKEDNGKIALYSSGKHCGEKKHKCVNLKVWQMSDGS